MRELKLTSIVALATIMIIGGILISVAGIQQERFFGFWGLTTMVLGFKILGRIK